MKLPVGMTALLVSCLLVSAAPHSLTSVWFGGREYDDLAELDRARGAGEISDEEYEILTEALLTGEVSDSASYLGITLEEAVPQRTGPRRLGYRGTLVQPLEEGGEYRRYDLIDFKQNEWECELDFEQRGAEPVLIRSRSISYKRGRTQLTLGSYSLKLGRGVAVGNAVFTSTLRREGSLVESLLLPVKNRENGFKGGTVIGPLAMTIFHSQLEGKEFYRKSSGGEVSLQMEKGAIGFIAMRQSVGAIGGESLVRHFIGPALAIEWAHLQCAGESSFLIDGGGGHSYSLEYNFEGVKQEVGVFSYSRGYRNPQSGGYAYSDYEQMEIGEIALSFSDKRSGRIGVTLSTLYAPTKVIRVQADLVRWRNRLDERECVAARGGVVLKPASGFLRDISVRGVWEDFDIAGAGVDQNRYLSTTTRFRLSTESDLKFYARLQERNSSSGRRLPVRIQADFRREMGRSLAARAGVYLYDPDWGVTADQYGGWYVEQVWQRELLFELATRVGSRYQPNADGWSDWEVRMVAEAAI